MAIDALGGVQSGVNQQSVSSDRNAMGKDQFLNILVAQLQNQDPLNPMDSTGFTAQLAQFSSLEQLQNVNTNLGNLTAAQASLSNSQAVNFIGKTVVASGSEFEIKNQTSDTIRFNLSGDAKEVQIAVYDAAGRYVRTIESGALSAGQQAVDWDGLDQNGAHLADGKYSYEVLAFNVNDQKISVSTYTSGQVTGINYKNGTPYLLANQIEIPMSSVVSVVESVDVEN